jgi:hypothetical protein
MLNFNLFSVEAFATLMKTMWKIFVFIQRVTIIALSLSLSPLIPCFPLLSLLSLNRQAKERLTLVLIIYKSTETFAESLSVLCHLSHRTIVTGIYRRFKSKKKEIPSCVVLYKCVGELWILNRWYVLWNALD